MKTKTSTPQKYAEQFKKRNAILGWLLAICAILLAVSVFITRGLIQT